MASTVHPPGPKPLLRGVSHEIAAAFAVAGGIALVQAANGQRGAVAAAVYGVALTAQFAISALYHRPRWGTRGRLIMRRLDHAAIFMLIAGTYTPFCLLLPPEAGRPLLLGVWMGASAGMLLSVLWPLAPKWLMALLCVALGWAVVPTMPAMLAAIGWSGARAARRRRHRLHRGGGGLRHPLPRPQPARLRVPRGLPRAGDRRGRLPLRRHRRDHRRHPLAVGQHGSAPGCGAGPVDVQPAPPAQKAANESRHMGLATK